MEGKNFFKLSRLKLALLFVILLLVFPFIHYDNGIRCIGAPCPNEETGTFIQYFDSQPHYIYSIDYSMLLIGILVSYLASCIIASVLEKTLKEKI